MPMFSPYSFLSRLWRWLLRWRHRQGYGIHSPFAFQLVTGVIYSSEDYYAYASLAAQRAKLKGLWSEKDDRLLFRLANHQMAQRILLVGQAMERPAAYVQAARRCAQVEQVAQLTDLAEALRHYDLVVVEQLSEALLGRLSPLLEAAPPLRDSGLLVVAFPHQNSESRALWQQLQAAPVLTVCFDLHRFGLAYLRPQLQAQNYLINYF